MFIDEFPKKVSFERDNETITMTVLLIATKAGPSGDNNIMDTFVAIGFDDDKNIHEEFLNTCKIIKTIRNGRQTWAAGYTGQKKRRNRANKKLGNSNTDNSPGGEATRGSDNDGKRK